MVDPAKRTLLALDYAQSPIAPPRQGDLRNRAEWSDAMAAIHEQLQGGEEPGMRTFIHISATRGRWAARKD